MIFVDTGAWYSFAVLEDVEHAAAVGWMRTNRQELITSDYVIDETLTLLRSRRQQRLALQVGRQLFSGALCQVYHLTEEDVRQTWETFQRFADKEWSFTDCASKVVMENLDLTQALVKSGTMV
jgi:predicted nucleic acid-binding protein